VCAHRDEDVAGLDVAVNDASAVRAVQSVCDVEREPQQFVRRHPAGCQGVFQRPTLEPLHRNERLAVMFANLVDRADGGVIERRGGARFTAKPLDGCRVARKPLGQKFQRDLAAEREVFGEVDDPHSAAA
jgi:hypothetical protein